MAKLKKYTLADLMQDRKKAQQRAMSSVYFFSLAI